LSHFWTALRLDKGTEKLKTPMAEKATKPKKAAKPAAPQKEKKQSDNVAKTLNKIRKNRRGEIFLNINGAVEEEEKK